MSPFPNDPYCYPGTDILRNLERFATGLLLKHLKRIQAPPT